MKAIHDAAAYFWARVSISEDCWEWTGSTRLGYGRFRIKGTGGVATSAHRFSWELHHGPLGPDDKVLHRCDNILDAAEKGRHRNPKLSGEQNPAAGEAHGSIAQDFPVNRQQVSRIVRRERWSHV